MSLWLCNKCKEMTNVMICPTCGNSNDRVQDGDIGPIAYYTASATTDISNPNRADSTRKGYFITLEGGECCGKGTQIKLLGELLRQEYRDREVIEVFDPGSTYMGQEIRRLVKNVGGDKAPTTLCELFLFSAARVQMVDKLILPNLEKGNIVISDRFIDSTTVYQGRMNKNSMSKINKINEVIGCYPDLTFILDISSEAFMKRMESRKDQEFDRYDTKGMEFHKRVFAEYINLYEEEKNNRAIHVINSEPSPEEVSKVLFQIASLNIDMIENA